MFGSYYETDYYRNPVPYDTSDVGEPVPGWGTTISVAGPARLGVGQVPRVRLGKEALRKMGIILMDTEGAEPPPGTVEAEKPLPWWIWPAAAAVILGGVGYIGTKQGWL